MDVGAAPRRSGPVAGRGRLRLSLVITTTRSRRMGEEKSGAHEMNNTANECAVGPGLRINDMNSI